MISTPKPKPAERRRAAKRADTFGLSMALAAGLTEGAKTRHLNAKVQPALFEAAARRAGSRSPSVVIEAALAALATQDDLGPWLARNWGVLADVDRHLLDQMEF